MIAVEARVVETAIGIADANRERRVIGCGMSIPRRSPELEGSRDGFLTVRSKVVYEVQVIRPEIHASEGRSRRHGEPGRASTGQGGIEIGSDCEGAGEGVV